MDNNQNNHPNSNEQKKGGRNANRRGRYHRPNKNNKRPASAEQFTELPIEEKTIEPAEEITNAEKSAGNHNRHGKKNARYGGNREHGTQDGEKKKNDGSSRGRSHGHHTESRPYNPYEEPTKAEIELSELRARIVLKSADGSVPTAYGSATPSSPEAPVEAPATTMPEESMTADAPLSPAPDEPSPVTEACEKVEVVGVRFRSSGKMYYFDPHGIVAQKGDFAIVETTRGPEFGDICLGNCMVNAKDTVAPLRPVLRIATPEDIAINADNREKEKKAFSVCLEKIQAHGLEMKLIDAQYAFDHSKLLFYFTADGRVDFRELVKDLASVFRTRIELRQIGIRDEAKMLGGIGACGRPICCATFLPDFAQVSIKMAKDQNLSLNSSKISGVCGRLMCCLRYEEDVYLEEIRKTPANDTPVKTEDGIGVVISSNPLAGTVRVAFKDEPDTPPKQYHRDNVTVLSREKKTFEKNKNEENN